LYTSDTQRFYSFCQNVLNVVALSHLDGTMVEYMDKVHALLHYFNELLPLPPLLNNLSKGQSSSCYWIYIRD